MTKRNQLGLGALVDFLMVTGLLWRQVFLMTGILWWQAPRPAARPEPPPAVAFAPANTAWIDLPTYLRNHPNWGM